ncbi:MAG: glycosyltransferase [Bosea sp.]|nr:glycosyltransferase [Bosea sp. (in: a-proteobacteria)]
MNDRKLRLGLLSFWLSRNGAGVFEAVVVQALAMRDSGLVEPQVFGLADDRSDTDAARFEGIPAKAFAVKGPPVFGFAPGLLDAIKAADLDVLHLHGIWMYPSRVAERWAAATGKPVVISPHGMLDPWILSRGRWKKAIARALYEKRSWKRAALFHALTEAEAADIRTAAPSAKVTIIANGVHPPAGTSPVPRTKFVFLSRIHPKKNVIALVEAWAALGTLPAERGFSLEIAGFGEAEHVAALEAAIRSADSPTIRFVGSVFGEDKARLLLSARYLVLPSLSEGLPMAILEAWAAGAPTVMSKDCNLPVGFERGIAIECGHGASSIAEALRKAMQLDEPAWSRISSNARELARERFSSDAISQAWVDTYAALAARGTR